MKTLCNPFSLSLAHSLNLSHPLASFCFVSVHKLKKTLLNELSSNGQLMMSSIHSGLTTTISRKVFFLNQRQGMEIRSEFCELTIFNSRLFCIQVTQKKFALPPIFFSSFLLLSSFLWIAKKFTQRHTQQSQKNTNRQNYFFLFFSWTNFSHEIKKPEAIWATGLLVMRTNIQALDGRRHSPWDDFFALCRYLWRIWNWFLSPSTSVPSTIGWLGDAISFSVTYA